MACLCVRRCPLVAQSGTKRPCLLWRQLEALLVGGTGRHKEALSLVETIGGTARWWHREAQGDSISLKAVGATVSWYGSTGGHCLMVHEQ